MEEALLNIGIKFLLGSTFLFFLIFWYLCRNWSHHIHPEASLKIGFLMSMMYSFFFFLGGFVVIFLIAFSWNNLVNLYFLLKESITAVIEFFKP